MSSGALFLPDAGLWMPTELSRGPWDPRALHGGPVAALVARAVEACEPDPATHVARLTLELLRPVPVAPLEVTAVMARPGRKVQVVDVTVSSDGSMLALGRALRIRMLDEAAPEAEELRQEAAGEGARSGDGGGEVPPGPEEAHQSLPLTTSYAGFHNGGAELRFALGEFAKRGPATVWVRLAVPVVAEEAPSPLQRVCAAADFGNGVSSLLDFARWIFINPDLTVFVDRPLDGEWVCLDASTELGTPGVGIAHCRLWDRRGTLGRSMQSLLVEPR
jgi:hypothetical protein